MLEQKPKGDAWMTRDAEAELSGDAAREAMWAYAQAVIHLGLQPAFLSPAMIEQGELQNRGIRTLILPHAVALSPGEAQAIRNFSGTVIADMQPGVFDAHSRRLARPLLDMATLHVIAPDDLHVSSLGVTPMVHADVSDVTVHIWHHGNEIIVAVQRDFKSAGADETVTLNWSTPCSVVDLRTNQSLRRQDHLTVTLDPVYPAVYALTP